MEKRPGFILYLRHKTLFEHLTLKERGELITAIFKFAECGEVTTFKSKALSMAYDIIAEQLGFDAREYEKKCSRNRENANKRWSGKDKSADLCDGIHSDDELSHTDADSSGKSDTVTDSYTNTDHNTAVPCGSYKNVHISLADYERLRCEYPSDTDELIEELSVYMKTSGRTYADHCAVVRQWAKKRDNKRKTEVDADDGEIDYLEAAIQRTQRYLESMNTEMAQNENDPSP